MPWNFALIVVEPTFNEDNVIDATPPDTGTRPTTWPAALKVTLPTGAVPVAVTVAVKVTASPWTDGFGEDVRTIDVGMAEPKCTDPIAR